MMNIEAAKAEIKHVEGVLRSRYHYPHPVFDYLAAALGYLEGEVAPSPPPPSQPQEAVADALPASETEAGEEAGEETAAQLEAEEAVAVEEAEVPAEAEETNAEPEPPARRAGRKR